MFWILHITDQKQKRQAGAMESLSGCILSQRKVLLVTSALLLSQFLGYFQLFDFSHIYQLGQISPEKRSYESWLAWLWRLILSWNVFYIYTREREQDNLVTKGNPEPEDLRTTSLRPMISGSEWPLGWWSEFKGQWVLTFKDGRRRLP